MGGVLPLEAGKSTNRDNLDQMLPLVYDELRRLARHYLNIERPDHTLQPTALVHEAYLRMLNQHSVDWNSRSEFFASASGMMRRILLNHAEARAAEKRQGMLNKASLDEALNAVEASTQMDLRIFDQALTRLEQRDPRQAHLVELKIYCGLTFSEASVVMGVSEATLKRDWSVARLFLKREMGI
jgi:RNA polymerase sigma factor (TIGR02999 family)